MEKNITEIYQRLYSYYGPQYWWPAETDFEMMTGAILVQNTNWKNVDKALNNIREDLTAEKLDRMDIDTLAQGIRSSGFYNIKARRLKAFLEWFREYGYKVAPLKEKTREAVRVELLNINGIGRETADVMLLYAFEKPVFVVDAYARRIFHRLGYDMPKTYEGFRKQMEKFLPEDLETYKEYHALIVEHAKVHCKAKPICTGCPLVDICDQRIE